MCRKTVESFEGNSVCLRLWQKIQLRVILGVCIIGSRRLDASHASQTKTRKSQSRRSGDFNMD